MTQTLAIFIAAYRELSARRLFWLALGITLLSVGLFSSLGINETGVSFLGWSFESPFFNTNTTSPETFYKLLFINFGVDWWLGLLSTLLALVTTCGIVPDLVAPGSVDLLLAKPISRRRLFLTKYCSGLLFAALQVLLFSTASFIAIGIRGNAWEWTLFAAVPIVTLFYSFLFSICALVGMITRSSVASLILTLVAWSVIFTIGFSETLVNRGRIANEMEQVAIEAALASTKEPPDEDARESLTEALSQANEQEATWQRGHFWLFGIKTILPKTTDTLALLDRWLIDSAAMPARDKESTRGPQEIFGPRHVKRGEFERRVTEEEHSRSIWWVLGTSLLFEGAVLAAATAIFVRRDY
ncbi:MAG: hypothetical protein EXS01_04990 [Phycisphaerales bacterium]|nr:hypothetical protein [Phycisphaerales bacterium]